MPDGLFNAHGLTSRQERGSWKLWSGLPWPLLEGAPAQPPSMPADPCTNQWTGTSNEMLQRLGWVLERTKKTVPRFRGIVKENLPANICKIVQMHVTICQAKLQECSVIHLAQVWQCLPPVTDSSAWLLHICLSCLHTFLRLTAACSTDWVMTCNDSPMKDMKASEVIGTSGNFAHATSACGPAIHQPR